MKPLMKPEERAFAEVLARLVACNHFLPERIRWEREALGSEFTADGSEAWNLNFDAPVRHPNLQRLAEKTATVVEAVRRRLMPGAPLAPEELSGYECLVHYHLYQRYRKDFEALIAGAATGAETTKCYRAFAEDLRCYLKPVRQEAPTQQETALLFAGFWQIERAFVQIFSQVVGSSASIARLRASIWESIFTCNFERYRRGLFERMHEITTLITGPSGTGKELVAKAIAGSAFIPIDPVKQRFTRDHRQLFFALNLSALSPNLIESELFGHKRGAFTGALTDHAGWLEVCPSAGAVFLDEIGEIDPALQVKLLRVLQTRTFHRLGESLPRPFPGRIIAATNRNLAAEMQAGRFREDFYYRICSDVVATPTLRDQLAESPEDLPRLVRFIVRQLVESELADDLTQEVVKGVDRDLGRNYAWPGNFRELEQCVRSILVRQRYAPLGARPADPAQALAADIAAGRLTADQLLRRYCSIVQAQTGNVEETARRLDLDRRTVKAKLAGLP